MLISLILVLILHAAAAIGWTVVTFVIARRDDLEARRLMRLQLIVGLVTVGAGGRMWMMLHAGGTGVVERVLAIGAVLAVLALIAQVALRRWRVRVNHITAWMLVVALITMELGKQLKGL